MWINCFILEHTFHSACFSWSLLISSFHIRIWGFPSGTVRKNTPVHEGDAGDTGLIPGLGRCRGGGHGNSLQRSCLENPMDRGAWRAPVHRTAKSQTWLSTHACRGLKKTLPRRWDLHWDLKAEKQLGEGWEEDFQGKGSSRHESLELEGELFYKFPQGQGGCCVETKGK